MVITRENNEIVIRIPEFDSGVDVKELQVLLDFIVYRQIVTKSKATQEEIDDLSREVNKSWWEENKTRFLSE